MSSKKQFLKGNDIDIKEFYSLKKILIDSKDKHKDLLELHLILEAMLEKST